MLLCFTHKEIKVIYYYSTKYKESLHRVILGNIVFLVVFSLKNIPTSDLEMDLIGMINASIISMQESNNIAYSVGTEQVFNAIRKLKNDKRDGLQDFYSNHITNASGRMHILLTLLINSMVIHGHWPPELLNSTILSIPKDNRGSLSNSENYRGIALSNCICKIIDTVLLNKYSAFLAS